MLRRTMSGSLAYVVAGHPAVPLVGSVSVVIIRTVVVLPAPLGPSSPSTVPCGTTKLTPSTAVVGAEFLDQIECFDGRMGTGMA